MRIIYFLLVCCAGLLSCCNDETASENTPIINESDEELQDYRTLYISPNGSDTNSGLYTNEPLKSFSKAIRMLNPGDVLSVMPGQYTSEGKPIIELIKEHSGTSEKYITIKAQDATNKPILHVGGNGTWNAISINASYVIIDGLELKGHNADLNYDEAYSNAEAHFIKSETVNWNTSARFNTNGITIGGSSTYSSHPDHVIIRNCSVHDFPGGGINVQQADYVTIEGNLVYNNCWFNMYGCSGISVLTPVNNDYSTDYKIIIRRNISCGNLNQIPWIGTKNFTISDGNGIIIDINNRPDDNGVAKGEGPYTGRTLVENNVTFNNGGSGIHSFKANHVDIINNTAYHNTNSFPENNYAEIWTNQCEDINISNNIMYARYNGCCNLKTHDKSERYSNNLYFGGSVITMGDNDKVCDPMFTNPSITLKEANFHLEAGSPAIGMGKYLPYMSEIDIEGKSRTGSIDAGAYQH